MYDAPLGESSRILADAILPKHKRNKMEIYYSILRAINLERKSGEALPTRVQIHSNLAYDKLERYLAELEGRNMIIVRPLSVTDRGQDFLRDYGRIEGFLKEMGLKYLAVDRGVSR
jgi:predicted transcriptional regulator